MICLWLEKQVTHTHTHNEIKILPSGLKIEYDKSVLSPDCPYQISLQEEGLAPLMKLAGIPPDRAGEFTVRIARGGIIGSRMYFGYYKRGAKEITIYGDGIWRDQERMRRRAERIISSQTRRSQPPYKKDLNTSLDTSRVRNRFRRLTSGQHFSWYLTVAPRERARKFAEWVIQAYGDTKMSSVLQHELKHVGDVLEGWYKLTTFLAGAGTAIISMSALPTEKRARGFERELRHRPRYQLITLTPKPKV